MKFELKFRISIITQFEYASHIIKLVNPKPLFMSETTLGAKF